MTVSDVGVMLGKKRWRILRSLFTLLKSQVSASLWMGVSTSRGCTFRAIHMASHRGWTSVEVLSWCQVFSQSNKQSSTRPKNFYCMWEVLFCHFFNVHSLPFFSLPFSLQTFCFVFFNTNFSVCVDWIWRINVWTKSALSVERLKWCTRKTKQDFLAFWSSL